MTKRFNDDLSQRCPDEAREAADLKIRTPGQQTSRTKGLTRPVVEVGSAPLPRNDEDSLYLVWPSRDESAPERKRDELGRYSKTDEKK